MPAFSFPLVGPPGLEPGTYGFTIQVFLGFSGGFPSAWTISPPEVEQALLIRVQDALTCH